MPDRSLVPAAMAALLCLTTTAVTAQTPPGPMSAERGWSSISRCAQENTERARHTCLDRVLREAGLLTDEMHAQQQRNAFGLENKPVRNATPPASAAVAPSKASGAPATAAATPPPGASAAAPSAAAAPRPGTVTSSSAAAASQSAAATPPAPTMTSRPGTATPLATAGASEAAPPAPPPPAIAPTPAATTPSPPPPSADRLDVQLAKVEKAVNGNLFVTTTEGAVWLQTETVDMPQPPVAGDRMTIRKGSLGGYRCSVASTHLTYRCARNR